MNNPQPNIWGFNHKIWDLLFKKKKFLCSMIYWGSVIYLDNYTPHEVDTIVLIYQVKYLYIRKWNPLAQYNTDKYQQGPGLLTQHPSTVLYTHTPRFSPNTENSTMWNRGIAWFTITTILPETPKMRTIEFEPGRNSQKQLSRLFNTGTYTLTCW